MTGAGDDRSDAAPDEARDGAPGPTEAADAAPARNPAGAEVGDAGVRGDDMVAGEAGGAPSTPGDGAGATGRAAAARGARRRAGVGTTRDAAIETAARRLEAAGVPGAGRDARLIARWAAGLGAAGLAAAGDRVMSKAEARRFEAAVAERIRRRPLAQITGRRLFWGFEFRVTPAVLDPRPESETLVAEALALGPTLPAAPSVVDLGTGSGCLLISVLAGLPGARGLGIDASAAALAVAAENAALAGLAGRTRFERGDWWSAATLSSGSVDLALCNPPYVSGAEIEGLDPEVRLFEPRSALVPDPDPAGDGLGAYRAVLAGAGRYLAPGGWLVFEVGQAQANAVAGLAERAGLVDMSVRRDMNDHERVVMGRRQPR